MLKGRPYALRLVLDQGYWPATLMAAPSDEAVRRDVELAKEMDFNGVRKHQKIENRRYLYWADKLGLLVGRNVLGVPSPALRSNARKIVERAYRARLQPSLHHRLGTLQRIMVGVPELPNFEAHRRAVHVLYQLTKTLDPTRPVLANNGWGEW